MSAEEPLFAFPPSTNKKNIEQDHRFLNAWLNQDWAFLCVTAAKTFQG